MSTIAEVHKKSVSEGRHIAIDLRGKLDIDEFLATIISVSEVTSDDLTISGKAISSDDLEIDGETVPAGQVIQFKVTGGVAGRKYTIRVLVSTTASPPQELEENIKLNVTAH